MRIKVCDAAWKKERARPCCHLSSTIKRCVCVCVCVCKYSATPAEMLTMSTHCNALSISGTSLLGSIVHVFKAGVFESRP